MFSTDTSKHRYGYRVKCCISSCGAKRQENRSTKFFKFPAREKNEVLFRKWHDACNLKDVLHKNLYLCERHFEKNLILKKNLKKESVPSLYLKNILNSFGSNIATYLKPTFNTEGSDVDLTLPEFQSISDEYFQKNVSTEYSSQKNDQDCQDYKNEILKLKLKIYNLEKKIKDIRKQSNLKYIALRRKINVLKVGSLSKKKNRETTTKTVSMFIDSLPVVNKNAKTFAKMLMTKQKTYSEDEKWLSQNIFFRNAALYNFMRETLEFHLPHPTSLYKWMDIKHLSPGFHEEVLSKIKEKVDELPEMSKNVVLIFDEISIEENVTYNKFKDRIDGLVDYGDGKREPIRGKTICVFMIRGLCSNFKYILNYVVTATSCPVLELKQQIFKCLHICANLGIFVRALTCDQGSTNRSLFLQLGNKEGIHKNIDNNWFVYEGKKIYLCFDVPHLVKSIRTNLITSDFCFPNGDVISWDVLRELYAIDSQNLVRACPKITQAHVDPTNFQKMSVSLATQVFSHSVSSAILAMLEVSGFSKTVEGKAKATSIFFKKIDKMFDILNGHPPLVKNSINIEFLNEVKDLLASLQLTKNTTVHCFKGMVLTITSFLSLADDLFTDYPDFSYFYLNKMNQDPLENFFSHVRARNANKRNPNVFEFQSIIAKIISLNLLFASKFSNCEKDSDEILDVDWSAVVNTTFEKPILDINTAKTEAKLSPDFDMIICFDSDERPSVSNTIKSMSIRYFAGYCIYKLFKSMKEPCRNCSQTLLKTDKTLTENSEFLMHHKVYSNSESDFGKLFPPSNIFFEICKLQINVFENIYIKSPEIINIKSKIISLCITKTDSFNPEWFKDPICSKHRLDALSFMILVLLRKNCIWTSKNTKKSGQKGKTQNKRLENLMNI